MTIDRAIFFNHLRESLFADGLSRAAVQGHEAILGAWEREHAGADDRWLAYILATAYHETAHTMQPVRETLATSDEKAAARLEAAWRAGKLPWVKTPYWRRDADGKFWFGRGLVQITFKDNYRKLGTAIGVDLVANPDRTLDMGVAVRIIVYGMLSGAFTGKRLADYFDGFRADWVNARRIINGLDRADAVAGHGKAYLKALRDKGI